MPLPFIAVLGKVATVLATGERIVKSVRGIVGDGKGPTVPAGVTEADRESFRRHLAEHEAAVRKHVSAEASRVVRELQHEINELKLELKHDKYQEAVAAYQIAVDNAAEGGSDLQLWREAQGKLRDAYSALDDVQEFALQFTLVVRFYVEATLRSNLSLKSVVSTAQMHCEKRLEELGAEFSQRKIEVRHANPGLDLTYSTTPTPQGSSFDLAVEESRQNARSELARFHVRGAAILEQVQLLSMLRVFLESVSPLKDE